MRHGILCIRILPKFLLFTFFLEKIDVKKFDKSNCVQFCSMVLYNMANNLGHFMYFFHRIILSCLTGTSDELLYIFSYAFFR